jgi:hypothetical protein
MVPFLYQRLKIQQECSVELDQQEKPPKMERLEDSVSDSRKGAKCYQSASLTKAKRDCWMQSILQSSLMKLDMQHPSQAKILVRVHDC